MDRAATTRDLGREAGSARLRRMTARKINLGRAVIVAGGLLVLAALASVFSGDLRTWAVVFAAITVGFTGLVVLGRTLGGRAAERLGQDRIAGQRSGIGLAVGLPLLLITLSRWLGLG